MHFSPHPSPSNDPIDAFSEMQLIELLGCSISTARRYTQKTHRPRPAEIAYLDAIRRRRIMPDEWPPSMYFHKGKLVTPIDREPLSWAHVQQAGWMRRQWYDTVDFLGKIERGLKSISERLTPAELVKVKPIQKEVQQVMAAENPLSHTARRREWFRRNGC